jgi:5-methylcytosine-specific restriction endonuclease McrA
MANPAPQTVHEQIAWAYSNLARAHAALKDDCKKYNKIHHMIRTKLYNGLVSGEMSMRSLYDDERVKLVFPHACCYCGDKNNLSVDHLIPRVLGGIDEADNLIWPVEVATAQSRAEIC